MSISIKGLVAVHAGSMIASCSQYGMSLTTRSGDRAIIVIQLYYKMLGGVVGHFASEEVRGRLAFAET